jgi:hypothetical protein
MPLEITGSRKDHPLLSSPLGSHGQSSGSYDALIELDDSLDEEIAKLTTTLGGVGI